STLRWTPTRTIPELGTKEIAVQSPVGRRVWFQKIPNLPGVRMPEFSKISATSLRRSHVSAIQFDPVLERRGMPTRGRHSTAGVRCPRSSARRTRLRRASARADRGLGAYRDRRVRTGTAVGTEYGQTMTEQQRQT